jgi:hypothetical protein
MGQVGIGITGNGIADYRSLLSRYQKKLADYGNFVALSELVNGYPRRRRGSITGLRIYRIGHIVSYCIKARLVVLNGRGEEIGRGKGRNLLGNNIKLVV